MTVLPYPNQPVFLCILDGWGISSQLKNNGIAQASTPVWDRLWQNCPHTTLEASELQVGLPMGQMGNSEVGHMSIGAGRIVFQDLPKIDQAIAHHTLPQQPVFIDFIEKLKDTQGACHLVGLVSPGGVHSHQQHLIYTALKLAEQGIQVWIHAFLDGRDTPPQSAKEYLETLNDAFVNQPLIRFATVAGRYYGMDRDKRWDRVKLAYDAIVQAKGVHFNDAIEVINAAYAQEISDEFVLPSVINDYPGMQTGDGLFTANFRADRVRQLLSAFVLPEFSSFPRTFNFSQLSATMGMGEYGEEFAPYIPALFPKEVLSQTLGEVISDAGWAQLRAAETEKYAHVTFFFNGGREQIFPQEERQLVPSPAVATYDLQPEMSAADLTDLLCESILSQRYALIVANFANPDMVGHTGIQPAIIKALEVVDQCLGRLVNACEQVQMTMMITADHGNVEQMVDNISGQPHTAHTCNPVPFVMLTSQKITLEPGNLSDIAPTVLKVLNLPQPSVMTGKCLIK